jgi:hypothetical protein
MIERAKWIRSPEDRDEACFEFYKRLHFEKKIRKATLCVTAMGLYKAYINARYEKIMLPAFEQAAGESLTEYNSTQGFSQSF